MSLAINTLVAIAQPAKTPAGYTISEESCASGGPIYSFCADGTVVRQNIGSEDIPSVSLGTWKLDNGVITMKFTMYYGGRGYDGIATVAAGNIYNKYKAVKEKISEEVLYSWDANTDSHGCLEISKSSIEKCNDARSVLWDIDMYSKYKFTSERLVTESELTKYSKEDLRIMRNEIYARYGYVFKSKDLTDYFAKAGRAYARLDDVTAFLTEIEAKNVEIIKKVESSK